MDSISIVHSFEDLQVNQDIVCILCDGTHGNNYNCQRTE